MKSGKERVVSKEQRRATSLYFKKMNQIHNSLRKLEGRFLIKNKYEILADDRVVIFMETRKGEKFETYISLDDFQKVNSYDVKWYVAWHKNNIMQEPHCI